MERATLMLKKISWAEKLNYIEKLELDIFNRIPKEMVNIHTEI